MEPWQSWLLALGLGGAAAVYYSQGAAKTKNTAARRTSNVAEQAEGATVPKRKQAKAKGSTPSKSILVDSTISKARQEKAAKGESPHRRGPSVSFGEEIGEDAQDDKEWARQLEATRKGFPISSGNRASAGTMKQDRKSKQVTDDVHQTPVANNVSDMLESAPAAASVIRLTGAEKAKKSHAPAAPIAQQETKKQRQNRKKAEEKKQQRELDEAERKKLLEQQRRTARESRGEPARNGLGLPQTSNVWSSDLAADGPAASTVEPAAPLLDTFEPLSQPHSRIPAQPALSTASPASSSTLNQAQVTEDSQSGTVNELNGWAEVSSKAKKGKKSKDAADGITAAAANAPVTSNMFRNGKSVNRLADVSTSELIGGQKKSTHANGYAALDAATDFPSMAKGHPQDSDWAAN